MTNRSHESGGIVSDSHRTPDIVFDVQGVAHLLQCSTKTIRRLSDSGRMPRPVRIGRLLRWRRRDIAEWLEAGCPRQYAKGARK